MTSNRPYYPLIIDVLGLGSGQFSKKNITDYKNQYNTIGFDNQDKQYILITTLTFDALGTIAKARTNRGLTVLDRNEFLDNLVNTIKTHIVNNEFTDVFLFGHSYGGAVVIRAAEELLKIQGASDLNKVKQKLHVRSYGSIYIPDAPLPIDAIHFSFVGDVAQKLHHRWHVREENAIGKAIVKDSDRNKYPTKGWDIVFAKYITLSAAFPNVYQDRSDIQIGCYNKNPTVKSDRIEYSCETVQLSRSVKSMTRKFLGKNQYYPGKRSLSLSPGNSSSSPVKTRKYKLRGALFGTKSEWKTHTEYYPTTYFDMYNAVHREYLV